MRPCPLLHTLLLLAALHVLGLALFSSGFLLSRAALSQRSLPLSSDATRVPHFSKAVFLIIDGLRWDVANGTAPTATFALRGGATRRLLSLPSLRTLFASSPKGSALFAPFRADAPTSTSQRLKGLLTGGLPAFVDASASFGAPELSEDSLLSQLVAAGRRVAFVGDDTWLDLFPNNSVTDFPTISYFSEAHPLPSLDVADLHTVDDGVAARLPLLLAAPGAYTWDVVIAHTLGVDHAAHTHGWDSRQMDAKLRETDALVASVAATLLHPGSIAFASTLFIVMGDHGMTWAGAHGGASDEETTTALLAIHCGAMAARAARASAPPPAWAACDEPGVAGSHEPLVFDQLDFAASFSPLLGVPAPFGSLGRARSDAWALVGCAGAASPGATSKRVSYRGTLEANARQVMAALDVHRAAGAFSPRTLASLRAAFDAATTEAPLRGGEIDGGGNVVALRRFLDGAAAAARAEWTTFNGTAMCAGLAVMAAALGCHAACLRSAMRSARRAPPHALAAAPRPLFRTRLSADIVHAAAQLSVCLALSCAAGSVGFMHTQRFYTFAAFAASTVLAAAASTHAARAGGGGGGRSAWPAAGVCASAAALVALRTDGEDKGAPLGILFSASSVCGAMAVPMLLLLLQRPRSPPPARPFAAAVLAAHASAAARFAMVSFGASPVSSSSAEAASRVSCVHLPRACYAAALAASALAATGRAWRRPRPIPNAPPGEQRPACSAGARDASRAVLCIASAPLLLLSGRPAPLAALAAAAHAAGLASCCRGARSPVPPVPSVPLCSAPPSLPPPPPPASPGARLLALAACCHVACRAAFVATGHVPSFESLHFAASFLGFDGFNYYVQGALLASNTWAATLAWTAALPWLADAADAGGVCTERFTETRDGSAAVPAASFAVLAHATSLLRCADAAAAAAAAAVLRRHLHGTSDFAPHFCFQAAGLLVADVALLACVAGAAGWNRREWRELGKPHAQ